MKTLYTLLDSTLRTGTISTIERGHKLPMDRLYRVQKGAILLQRRSKSGYEAILGFALGDAYFGCGLSAARMEAIAACETELMEWPIETFNAFHVTNSGSVNRYLRYHLEETENRIAMFFDSSSRIYDRFLYSLAEVADSAGTPGLNGWVTLPPWLTHQIVANHIGTSREIITNSFSRAANAGVADCLPSRKARRFHPARAREALSKKGFRAVA